MSIGMRQSHRCRGLCQQVLVWETSECAHRLVGSQCIYSDTVHMFERVYVNIRSTDCLIAFSYFRMFTRLLLDLPRIPPVVLDIVQSYCEDEVCRSILNFHS